MATNPMQRQKRVSMLLGMVIMLLIMAIPVVFLGMQLLQIKQKEKEEKQAAKDVYVLSQDVGSGESISTDMLTQSIAKKEFVPSNLATTIDFTDKESGADRTDLVAKIDLKKGSIITKDMITTNTEKVTDDLRTQEYNFFTLPAQIEEGDFVDVRFRLKSGQDYIVVSKKKVTIPMIAEVPVEDTIDLNLSEDEILTMSNAIVEAAGMKGSELYVTKYVEPGMQKNATPTYPIKQEVLALVNSNPNIVEDSKKALWARYNTEQRNNIINQELQAASEDLDSNIETAIEEHNTKQKELRKKYLDSLNAAATVE